MILLYRPAHSELLDDIFLYHILSNKKHKIGIRALILDPRNIDPLGIILATAN